MSHISTPTHKTIQTIALNTLALSISLLAANMSTAQTTQATRAANAALLEEVIVTARKREEGAQETPLSITALGSQQLEALKIRNLTSLAVGLPNVALDDAGTTRGTANFSIRGLGINSSIPSIDPTVGIFVDGVYMGLNNGIILDTFDLESVEVLRGPQGILFGRNVTGGAVLINTKRPTQETEIKVRSAVEGGGEAPNTYLMASASGGLTDTLAGKIVAYYNEDQGWFKNTYDGEAFGKAKSTMARAVLAWDPSDSFDLTLRYEYYDQESDGPAAQSHTNGAGVNGFWGNFDRDSFDFSVNETGFLENQSDFISVEFNWDIGPGTLTNIAGWRESGGPSLGDIDASPMSFFHSNAELNAEQFSDELRYNVVFNENVNLTTGLYYFTNEMNYYEGRVYFGGAQTLDGGGNYTVDTLGAFVAMDYNLSDALTLSIGGRYTQEKKDVEIASLIFNVNSPCNVVDGTCPYDFVDDKTWTNFSPKVGFNYDLSQDAMLYGHYSNGIRSGGYNLRNTSITEAPGPFDEENVNNYELGFKTQFGGKGKLNGAIFYNQISDMQREVNLSDPFAGVVQVIRNTADANILGMELDSTYALSDSLVLQASVGLIEPQYTKVIYDLNGDGVIDSDDEKLDLPRAAKLTYSIGINHEYALGEWGYMASRISYAHRDESAYTDNNQGYINAQNMLNAGIDFYSNDNHWSIGLYGNNLLNEVKHGGDTQLPAMIGPAPLGGTFAPLSKGLVYGLDVTYQF